jgi:hypothetical protein
LAPLLEGSIGALFTPDLQTAGSDCGVHNIKGQFVHVRSSGIFAELLVLFSNASKCRKKIKAYSDVIDNKAAEE